MRISQITVERAPGIDETFSLDLDAPVNVIHGRNESGKSTIVRLIRRALWPKSETGTFVSIQTEGEGRSTRATFDGSLGKTTWFDSDGAVCDPPRIPEEDALAASATITINELLQVGGNPTNDLGKRFARELVGGIDIDTAVATLNRSVPTGISEAKQFKGAQESLEALQDAEQSLRAESGQLPVIEGRLAHAREAEKLAQVAEVMVTVRSATVERQRLNDLRTALPQQLASISEQSFSRLHELAQTIKEHTQQLGKLSKQSESISKEVDASTLTQPISGAQTIEPALHLARLRDECAAGIAHCDAQIAAAQSQVTAQLKRIQAGGLSQSTTEFSEQWLVMSLDTARGLVVEHATLEAQLAAAKHARENIGKATSNRGSGTTVAISEDGSTNRTIKTLHLAVVVLAAVAAGASLWITTQIHAAGALIGLLTVTLAVVVIRATQTTAPASPTDELEWRHRLESEQAEAAVNSAIDELDELEKRFGTLREDLALPHELSLSALPVHLDALLMIARATADIDSATSQRHELSQRFNAHRTEMLDLTEGFFLREPAGETADFSIEQIELYRRDSERLEVAHTQLNLVRFDSEKVSHQLDTMRAQQSEILATLGLTDEDDVALAELRALLPTWIQLTADLTLAEHTVAQAHGRLQDVCTEHGIDEHEHARMGTLGDAELADYLVELRATAAHRDSLIEQRVELITRIHEASSATQLSDHAAELETARDNLTNAFHQVVGRAVVEELAHWLREQYDRTQSPEIIHRADYLLAQSTGGRYSLAHIPHDNSSAEITVRDSASPDSGSRDHGTKSLDQLSTATRMQVLVALRIAYVEHAENSNETLPILLDEVMATSDEHRTESIVDCIAACVRTTPRQFIYFASRKSQAQEICELFAERGITAQAIDLDAVRRLPEENADGGTPRESRPLPATPTFDPPHENDSWETYLLRIEISASLNPLVAARAPECCHVLHLTDSALQLHSVLSANLDSVGQVDRLYGLNMLGNLVGDEYARDLHVASTVFAAFCTAYSVGRPLPVTPAILDRLLADAWGSDTKATREVREKWHTPLINVLQLPHIAGDARTFLEELAGDRKHQDHDYLKRFTASRYENFEQLLFEYGCLSHEPALSRDDVLISALEPANEFGLDTLHLQRINASIHRWWNAATAGM